MTTLHQKCIIFVDKLIRISDFTNREANLRNTSKGLHFIYMCKNAINEEYIEIVKQLLQYIKNYKPYVHNSLEYYNLLQLVTVLEHPPSKFPIGTRVYATVDKIYGIVDDYDYKLNTYMIRCNNNTTHGWLKENDLRKVT